MGRASKFFVMCGLAALVCGLAPMAAAAGDEQERKTPPALVQIEQVEVHLSLLGPVVLLKVRGKAIPIFVDPVVAESINAALTGQKTHRPLSHDLMRTILRAFDGRVSRVVVTLKGATYYADLTVIVGDSAKVFDSRSSDAIALAVHFKAPILVSQELVDSAGKEVEVPNERRL